MAPSRSSCRLQKFNRYRPYLVAVLHSVYILMNVVALLCFGNGRRVRQRRELFRETLNACNTLIWVTSGWIKTSPREKLFWSYPGRSLWFHDTVLKLWDDRQWLENFRMTRRTLFGVAEKLRPYLMRRDTVMHSAVPVEERVAIGVYYLASRSCYRTIALVFHKGYSTVASIVIEVCLAMEHVLLKEEVRLPEFNKMTSSMKNFGFPHAIGCIDGTHIPISPPKLQGPAYFNRKSFHSVLLQAACDGDGIFFSMLTGHSSVNHDAHVFRSSMLFSMMEEGTLIPGSPMFHYAGVSIPPIILGDGAYPLCKWLMKPFAVPRNERERHYNKIFNRTRCVVERAFGRLKARFRRLSVRIEAHIENVNSIIASAVVLHNICEREKHDIPDEEDHPVPIHVVHDCSEITDINRSGTARAEAEAVRNAIAEYLYTHVK